MEPLRPPLLKRLGRRQWIAIDCVAAVVVLSSLALVTRGRVVAGGPSWAGVSALLVSVVAAGLRRCWTLIGTAVVCAVCAAAASLSASPVLPVALGLVMYLVPRRFPGRQGGWLLGGALVLLAVAGFGDPVRHGGAGQSPAASLLGLAAVAAGWAVGHLVAQRRRYAAALREQDEQRARALATEERLRIARELHDVLAHSMGLIAVQAGVANHVAEQRPEEARRALASIEETSRGALRELRALLGVLRSGDGGAAPGAPAPALGPAELAALVRRAAGAELRVDLQVRGERPQLTTGLELAVYRVIQESVTNVVKHARVDACRVALDFRPDAVSVEISDDGRARTTDPGGHGIAGMRERVALYGGVLSAGPRPGGGFTVRAELPLDADGVVPEQSAAGVVR